jgi:hypothetical protein
MRSFPLLNINHTAAGAIAPYRIVAAASGGAVAQAAGPDGALVGVNGQLGRELGERIDVEHAGVVPVEYGGAVDAGAPLTSDAAGRAVAAEPGDRIIGFAFEDGEADEVGTVYISPGFVPFPEPE